jgi:ribosome biogenesis protein ENP2
MALQVSAANDVKVYNISTGKSLPEWISERKKRNLLRHDEGLRRRIELIQDFKMPTAATHVQMTPDNMYIFAAGVYKPRIRCYDTTQLSMKFERCVDHEITAMKILSDDYSKFVLLQNNRNIEFHVQHGLYHSMRIPTFGRDLSYHYPSCDLYIPSSCSDVYRVNLEQGQFMSPLTINQSDEANVSALCEDHGLLAVGTASGNVECFDPRSQARVGLLVVSNSLLEDQNSSPVTALKFNGSLTLGVGTGSGHVLLYDIRSCRPYSIKDHHYQLPVNSIAFHSQPDLILSSDKKALRAWHSTTCEPYVTIQTDNDINCVHCVKDTGLLFIATEQSQILSYFIPSLGPAPSWCSFLDNLTEELEETPQTMIYDDYKFVTKKELEGLGLDNLIGTNVLRAYMHGYFMDIRLYRKAKSIVEPFAYEEYRKQMIQKKIEEERVDRVQKKKLPKVNREMAERLMEVNNNKGDNLKKNKKNKTTNPLTDERFSAMFSNPDYQVDPQSQEYKLLNCPKSQSVVDTSQHEMGSDEEMEYDTDGIRGKPNTIMSNVASRLHKPTITLMKGDVDKSSQSTSKLILGERIDNNGYDANDRITSNVEDLSFGCHETTFTMKKVFYCHVFVTLCNSTLEQQRVGHIYIFG